MHVEESQEPLTRALKMWTEHAMDILLSSSSCFEMDLLCTDGMTEWMAVIESFVKCPRDPISKVVKWGWKPADSRSVIKKTDSWLLS